MRRNYDYSIKYKIDNKVYNYVKYIESICSDASQW